MENCVIKKQGSIIVNNCWIHKRSDDIVLLIIDCKSKYFDIIMTGYSSDGITSIFMDSNDRTLNKSDEFIGPTEIEFPDYKGFRVFATNTGRYTCQICLSKDE